jgi:hypothetical protein
MMPQCNRILKYYLVFKLVMIYGLKYIARRGLFRMQYYTLIMWYVLKASPRSFEAAS